jgi:hypothetical protein
MNIGEKSKKNFPEVKEFNVISTNPAIPKPTRRRLNNAGFTQK